MHRQFFMKHARPISRLFSTSSTTLKPKRVTNNSLSMTSTKELHAHLIRTQLDTDPYAISPVLRSYALSPSHLHKARLVFNRIEKPTLLIFNYLIRGLAQSDKPNEAIYMYCDLMYNKEVLGDNLTFIFLFKACAVVKDLLHGLVFHVQALKLGFESYLFVSNALIRMFGSVGDLVLAQKVFDLMQERDLVSWNSLICGYSQCNRFKEVLGLFNSMKEANVKGDAVTMVKVLLACRNLGDWEMGDHMVEYTEDNNVDIDVYLGNTLIDMYGQRGSVDLAKEVFDKMQERNIVSWNAMITGYAKAGNLVAARKLFNEMPSRNVVSWTSLITGYAQVNQFSDAVELFRDMMAAKMKPDEITVASVLSACAHLGSLDVAQEVYNYICEHGVREDVYVRNALIDMYCKCGVVEKALEVFHTMENKDNVSWTSIISGLAVNGYANSAIDFFSRMLTYGVQPTHGSFIGVLLACTHAGLVDKGLEFFESMENVHGLMPGMKHYGCAVDLLSRSGNLDAAYEFIKAMPMAPSVLIWRIFLSACRLHGNLALAEIATSKLLELDPSNGGNYVLLLNTYAGCGRWNDATIMRQLMEEECVLKPSGWSSIKVK